jgi:hypothetical protein
LGENWRGSIINFDPKKHEIGTSLLMPGCPVLEGDRYRVKKNRPILIHKEEITQQGGLPRFNCTVTVSDLIGGTMRVTGARRFDAPEQPVK